MALGGAALNAMNFGSRASDSGRKWVAVTHGIGLLIALVGGFGLLARLGISHGADWPLWVWIKLGIWLVFGGMTALIGRNPRHVGLFWVLIPVLAVTAAYLAINKPF